MSASVSLSPLPKMQFNQNGIPVAGGKLFTYVSGTTTKTPTYTNYTGNTWNPNPIILDVNGQCNLWLVDGQEYTLVLSPSTDTDPPTNPYWTVNGVINSGLSNGGTISGSLDITNNLNVGGTATVSGNMTIGGDLNLGTPLAVVDGGTGEGSLAANAVLLGNGTSPIATVAPGSMGNVLTSNGSTWTSAAPGGSGNQIQTTVIASTGTWTAPAGVTSVLAVVVGGGGGGAVDACVTANGGMGGVAIGEYTVVPGTPYGITVGAGGTGVNGIGPAASGGASSFASFCSATGGGGGDASATADGANGTGTGGTIRNSALAIGGTFFAGGTTGATNSIPYTWTIDSDAAAGAGGNYLSTVATAGTSGAVYLQWVG